MLRQFLKNDFKNTLARLLPIYLGLFIITFLLFHGLKKGFTLNFKFLLFTSIGLSMLFRLITWVILEISYSHQLNYFLNLSPSTQSTIYKLVTSSSFMALFWTIVSDLLAFVNFILLIGGFNNVFFTSLVTPAPLPSTTLKHTLSLISTDPFLRQVVAILGSLTFISFLTAISLIFMGYLTLTLSTLWSKKEQRWLVAIGLFISLLSVFVLLFLLVLLLVLHYATTFYFIFLALIGSLILFNLILLLLHTCYLHRLQTLSKHNLSSIEIRE